MAEPHVYDIRDIDVYIGERKLTEFAPAGLTITPSPENTLIKGLKGEVGFNVDPSTAAEVSVKLKSTSPEVGYLRDLWNAQLQGHRVTNIRVTSASPASTGFSEIVIEYAMLSKPPEYATNEKESPDLEFTFIGYNYREVP